MTVTIRKFAPDDWPLYRAIRLEALQREPQVYGTGLHQARAYTDDDWRQRLVNPDAGTFGALDGDAAIGMAGWFLAPGANQRHQASVIGVYVRDGYRGRAIGRRLVEATVADAETRAEDVNLHVATTNEPARRLYETLGFRVVATLPRALKYAGTYYDEHLMVREARPRDQPVND
ncbi:MAG: GNAT family N-acetyltransferase [Alphaproteobacteria bacterium]|nr:GNAT family N-acetyltransferase [Alphaproteobacteria bacterium]